MTEKLNPKTAQTDTEDVLDIYGALVDAEAARKQAHAQAKVKARASKVADQPAVLAGPNSDLHIARLEGLAEEILSWADAAFLAAAVNADTPQQAAALARDGMTLAKGYVSMLDAIDRLYEKRAKKA